MKKESIKILITFTEPILGSANNNKDIHAEYIASKAETVEAAKEEVDALPVQEQIEKSMTVFARDPQGRLHLWDYMVRGFIKESLGTMIELGESKISKWQHKKAVDSLVFVNPRRIILLQPDGQPWTKPVGTLQRPLRADTMQGERVALANSEMLPEGTMAQFEIILLAGDSPNSRSKLAVFDKELITKLLDYGCLKGFGQWRSGGHGRFTWQEIA